MPSFRIHLFGWLVALLFFAALLTNGLQSALAGAGYWVGGSRRPLREDTLSRQRLSMDPGWRFRTGDSPGAEKPEFDDASWRVLDLPHDWSIENEFIKDAPTGGQGGYLPTGIGWYRKHFSLSSTSMHRSVWIEFDGVYQNSEVWINGHALGRRPNGYVSFVYDLGPFLKKGSNILTVRVDNSKQPNSRWYTGSGIYRHVWLTIADPLHIPPWGVYVRATRADKSSSTLSVRTRVAGGSGLPPGTLLRSVLLDAEGRELARADKLLPQGDAPASHDTTEWEQEISVVSPTLWSVERPYLYLLRSLLIEHGKVLDAVSTPFGIRDIRFDADKGFILNGSPLKMNGVCLHHDGGSVGAAVPEAVWARRLQVLKDMGCNAIRTSHNPPAPEFLDLCDRMGFLVMDEAFDVWEAGKVQNDYHLYFDEWWQRDLKDQVDRDRNHPSVVLWSAGNEIPDQNTGRGVELLKQLQAFFHGEDPGRLVTTGNDDIAADNGSTDPAFLETEDVVGYNYVDRWHERRELYYGIDRHDYPSRKMIGTESVSIPGVRGNYHGGGYYEGRAYGVDSLAVRAANMAAVIRAELLWKFVAVHDYVAGDFMWTGFDYLGEARWPAKNSSSGVIDLCGFPKDGYYFYQSQWTSRPMIHLFPHWNWKGREGRVIPVTAYTNCDSVELFLNGKSYGIKAMEFPRQGNSGGWNQYALPQVNATTGDLHLSWDIPYAPGVLRALGRKGGRVVCEEEVQTTSEPAAIRLSMEGPGVMGGIAQVRIGIVDKDGRLVPDADNAVQLTVEGGGSLIGYDNGNPTDHTSMKDSRRNVFGGLALAILQFSRNKGAIRVRAESPGLGGAEILLQP